MSESSRYDHLSKTLPMKMANLGIKPTTHELERAVKILIIPVEETFQRKSVCKSVICACCLNQSSHKSPEVDILPRSFPDFHWVERLNMEKPLAEKFSVNLNSQMAKSDCFAGTRGQHKSQKIMSTVKPDVKSSQSRQRLWCSSIQVPFVEEDSEMKVLSGLVSPL